MSNTQMTDREMKFWDSVHFHAIAEAKALPNHTEAQLFELIKDDIVKPDGMQQHKYEAFVASAVQEGWRAARFPEDTQAYENEVREAKRQAMIARIAARKAVQS